MWPRLVFLLFLTIGFSARAENNSNTALQSLPPTALVVNPDPALAAPVSSDTPMALTPSAPPAPAVPVMAWSTLGPRAFGRNYQVYIPMEIKSNAPDVLRANDASGYPHNGKGVTGEGLACATDADCRAPLGCFARADSGALAVRLCAFPPDY